MSTPSSSPTASRRAAWALYPAELAAIAAAYFVAATLSLRFASIQPSVTPVWPPTGIAIGLVLLRGYRIWPAILIGAIVANLPAAGPAALSMGLGNTLEALLGGWLVNTLAGGAQAFRSAAGVVRFAALVGGIATPLCATIGVASLALAGRMAGSDLTPVWITWWLGDFAGAVVVAPIIVLWAADPPHWTSPRLRMWEPWGIGLTTALVGLVALGPAFRPPAASALAFLAILPLLWSSLRGRERDTATAGLILSGLAIWGAAAGGGPFVERTLNDTFLMLVAFMISVSVPSMALSAALTARGRALAASEAGHRMLIEGVRDYAIFMVDAEGLISSWNSGAAKIYGYRASEIVGEPMARLQPAEDAGAETEGLARQAVADGRAEHEGWRVRRDGSRFWANVVMNAIRDDRGRLVGYVKITRDVTEQRRASETLEQTREQLLQAQKLEALGQLTGGVAHDFNNLLMVISGRADQLARRLNDPAVLRSLDAIKAAVARGTSLTRQLLSFARRQALAPEVIDLHARLEAMRAMLQSCVGEAVDLEIEVARGAGPVEVDPDALELALMNLAVNARDAMPGGGKLRISARNVGGAGERGAVEVAVTDTGDGMAPEVLAKAFDPFFTTKPVGKGTGLGLSQVHGFALQSGGDAAVESAPGQGCKVTLRLPRAQAVVAEPAKARRRRLTRSHGVALLVEDNADVAEITSALLQELGCRVVRAANAAEALRHLASGARIDLVLSDVVMPGAIDGFALAHDIRRQRPDLPIVLATAYGGPREALPPDVQMLRKPFDAEALSAVLATALSRLAQPAG